MAQVTDGVAELIQLFGSIKPESGHAIQAPHAEPFYTYPESGRIPGCLYSDTQKRLEESSQKLQGRYGRTKESILLDPNETGLPATFKEFSDGVPVLSLEDLNGVTLQREIFSSWREQDPDDLEPSSDGIPLQSWDVQLSDALVQNFLSSTIQRPLIADAAAKEPHFSANPQSIFNTDFALASTELSAIPNPGIKPVEESAQRWLNPGLNWKASTAGETSSRKEALRSRARQAQYHSPQYTNDKIYSPPTDPSMNEHLQQLGLLSVNTFYAIPPTEKQVGPLAYSAQTSYEDLLSTNLSPEESSFGVSSTGFNQVIPGVWFPLTSNAHPQSPLSVSEFSPSSSSSSQCTPPTSAYPPTESSQCPHSSMVLNELWGSPSSVYSYPVETAAVHAAMTPDFDPYIAFGIGGALDLSINGTQHLNQPLPNLDRPGNMTAFSTHLTCGMDGCLERFADEKSLSQHCKKAAVHNPTTVLCSRCDSTLSRTDAWKRHTKKNVCEHRNQFNRFRLQNPPHAASAESQEPPEFSTSESSPTSAKNGDSVTPHSLPLHAISQHHSNAVPEPTAGSAIISIDLQPPAPEARANDAQPSGSVTLRLAPPPTSPSEKTPAKAAGTAKKKKSPSNPVDLLGGIVCGLDGCEEVIARHDDMNRHRRTAIFHKPKPYICPRCRSQFPRRDSLNRHLERNACGKRRTPLDKAAEADAAAAQKKGRGRSGSHGRPAVVR